MKQPGTMLKISEDDSLSRFDKVVAKTRWYTAIYKKTSFHKGEWWYMLDEVKTFPEGDNADYPDIEAVSGVDGVK